jgi:uncharacterized membrane-anchored protein YitT (DUF2179 family)
MRKIYSFLLFLINIPLLIVEFLVIGRFVIELSASHETNQYTRWIYYYSDRLIQPFNSMLPTTAIEDKYILDPSILLAAATFALIAYVFRYFIARARDAGRQ